MSYRDSRARAVSLRALLPDARFFGGDDILVGACTADPRTVRQGDVFVSLEAEGIDSAARAELARRRGAVAVVAERLLPVSAPLALVADARRAYGRVCHALAGHPSQWLTTIGVSGSQGKTVVGVLLASILEKAGRQVGMLGTLGYCDGVEAVPAPRTTPPAAELADWLGRMAAHGCTHAVIEASSVALADWRMEGVELDGAILTNVRRDHVEEHGSVVNLRKIKSRLFSLLKPGGFAIVNADDAASHDLLTRLSCPTLTHGLASPAELTAEIIERYLGEQTFLLTAGRETAPVCTRMIGDHHVSNCLAAAAAALVLGIDLPTIVRGLEAVEAIPGRLERIECGQPFGVFVDIARTPDSLAAALKSLRRTVEGRVICVFGAWGGQRRGERPQLGRVVEKYADLGIIANDNPGQEEPLQIAHDILDGYNRPARAHILPDRADAICWALRQARPGDAVLIAGKGNENLQLVRGERRHFDDREAVRTWLYEVGAKIEYETVSAGPRLRPFRAA